MESGKASEASWLDRIQRGIEREIWGPPEAASSFSRALRSPLQILAVVVQETLRDQLPLRASALTYYSVLALVPLLALTLAMASALGSTAGYDVAALFVDWVAAGSPETKDRLLELVRGVKLGALGTIGALMLFLTTVLGISSVERTFNTVWGIERVRPWHRRLPDYLAVLIVAPLLLGVALISGTALKSQAAVQWLLEVPVFSSMYDAGLRYLPLALLWIAFSFLYWFLPNTRVRIRAALLGGAVAALLFSLAQTFYVQANAGATRYDVLFQGLASLALLFVWIYVSWMIVLVGSEFAYAMQSLGVVRAAKRGIEPGPAARDAVGLALTTHLARVFQSGEPPLTPPQLSEALGVSVRSVNTVLSKLQDAGIVTPRGDDPDAYQLGRAAERIRVTEVISSLQGPRHSVARAPGVGSSVDQAIADLDRAAESALAGRTIADLLNTT